MPIDYRKLKGRIKEVFGTQGIFANKMGWSERTSSLKLNGKISWRQDEILLAAELLKLDESDIVPYFFTLKVQDIEHLV